MPNVKAQSSNEAQNPNEPKEKSNIKLFVIDLTFGF
jgi:hypothetical protein